MWMTADELETYTGCKRRKDQITVLKQKRVKHDINKRGEILVARGHIEHRFGVGAPPAPEPDFTIFQRPGVI